MNAPPRRKPSVPDASDGGGTLGDFVAKRRAGLGALAVVIAAVVAGTVIRARMRESIEWDSANLLMPAAIELRGVAPWVRSDLKADALKAASLDGGLPLTDPELPNRLARGFDTHPWVKRVVRVTLADPPAAVVEVVCREPVAMIGVKGGLLAVDEEGVVLPSGDFTAEAAAEYPRISGVESSPQGPEGSRWGDPVVEEGAAVAGVIGPEWKSLGLVDLRPIAQRGAVQWQLVGPEGRTILFGSAPGREADGEPSTAEKIARLKALEGKPLPAEGIDLTNK
jgi:hypothetical protein